MRSKFLPSLVLALISVFGPAAAAAQKEIVVWHGYRGDEKAAFEKVIQQFNQSHPNIKASALAVPKLKKATEQVAARLSPGDASENLRQLERLADQVPAGHQRWDRGGLNRRRRLVAGVAKGPQHPLVDTQVGEGQLQVVVIVLGRCHCL